MSPEGSDVGQERQARIQRLIESGDVVDAVDAAEAITEEDWAKRFRGYDRERVLSAMRADIAELDERWAHREESPLSAEEVADRHDLRFEAAIVDAAGDNPDEREYLVYQNSLEILGNDPDEGQARVRNESTKRRLERKAAEVTARIGIPRSEELLAAYRRKLVELFSTY